MPILIAYVLLVGLFVGGGYGTLLWLSEPEAPPQKVAYHSKPPIASGRLGSVASEPDHTPGSAQSSARTVGAAKPEAAPPPKLTADAVAPSAAEASQEAGTRSAPVSSDTVPSPMTQSSGPQVGAAPAAQNPTPQQTAARDAESPVAEAKAEMPASSPPAISPPAAPTANTSAPSEDSAKAAASPSPKATSADASSRHRKSRRVQTASRSAESRLETMTLRTVQFPDGTRRSFLIPLRGRAMAYDPYD